MTTTHLVCKFTAPDGHACGRPMTGSGNLGNYCIFHRHHENIVYAGASPQVNFMEELQKEIDSKNGNWRGFSFPPEFRLPNLVDFEINAQFSIFNNFKLESVTFEEECRFTNSKFRGDTQFKTCNFKKNTDFTKCVFENKTEFLSIYFFGVATFGDSEFIDRVSLRVNFAESANFNSTIFKDAVTFSGWRNISLSLSSASLTMSGGFASITQSNQTIAQKIKQNWHAFLHKIEVYRKTAIKAFKKLLVSLKSNVAKIKRRLFANNEGIRDFLVFEKEGQLSNVIFYKPEQVIFKDVNMSQVYLLGTNFRGARFLGVNWYQAKLKRNGLHEDSWIRDSGDASHMKKYFPQLEESYRNIRAALEDNLNYQAAADFYVGEIDAQRSQLNLFQRHFFSVVAWYKAVSNYGTNVFTAFRILLWIILLHWALSMYLNFNHELHDVQYAWRLFQRSLTQFTIQSISESAYYVADEFKQKWVDIGLKLLGISQLAMLIFAFRSRIKRH